MNWVVKDVGVDLAAGVGYTDSIKRYPLWSWIPSEPWPGELCLARFTAIPKFGRNSSQLEFRYLKVIGHGDRLAVYRIIKFYPDKYSIDLEDLSRIGGVSRDIVDHLEHHFIASTPLIDHRGSPIPRLLHYVDRDA